MKAQSLRWLAGVIAPFLTLGGSAWAATSVELAATGTPILHPTALSAGTYADGFYIELAFLNAPASLNYPLRSEFFLSSNSTFGDGDDVKIGECLHMAGGQSGGGMLTSHSLKMETTFFLTNLFIPSNLGGDYYFFHRVSFSLDSYQDIDPSNNVTRGADLIHVRPAPGPADTFAPAGIDNERIMLVNTVSAQGTNGLGNTLVSFGSGTFSMPYRSALFPAETGTCSYVVTGNNSALVTTFTTAGALAGLQRTAALSFDSTNTGTFVYSATIGGFPVDSGSGFFYEVTPIRCQLSSVGRQPPLTWSGGAPPFLVETATNLASTNAWTELRDPVTAQPVGEVIFLRPGDMPSPLSNSAGFFRVRGQ